MVAPLVCPRCGSKLVDDNGVLVCPNCGYIYDGNELSDGPEWRSLSNGNVKGVERASYSNDPLMHDLGIGNLRMSPARSRSPLMRVRNLRMRIGSSHPLLKGEAPLVNMFSIAKKAASAFELSDSAKDALGQVLHAYAERAKKPIGRDVNKVVAAALEKVVEVYNLSISKGEIESFFEIDDNDLWDGLKKLNDVGALDMLKVVVASEGQGRVLERSFTYINRIASSLSLPQQVVQDSLNFIRKSLGVAGKTPYGKKPEALAAAAVYLVARLNGYEISQSDVAKVVGIKESTVRKLYRFLMDNMVVVVDV
ncbi:TFIIB-type zinc ribbon-containing protein [Acidilobus saccharovorans]|uniref:TFIIB-type zinc ribbon-containing protein n=1 Tax=Acidilobus saccharovorans TaxID=242703 RepID=UPI0006626A8C|nr:transcription initiation factor IIB family protein [Acidilobus saccharovorans]